VKKKGTRTGKRNGTRAGTRASRPAIEKRGTRTGKRKGTQAGTRASRPAIKERGKRTSGPHQQDLGARASGPQSNNEALAERDDTGWVIRAPRVGIFRRGAVETDLVAQTGDVVGTLGVLSRRIPLVLPADVDGHIAESMLSDRTQAVEYGQPLFRIRAETSGGVKKGAGPASVAAESQGAAEVPEGCFPVLSPIDGIFYTRPSPGAPPFVETGAVIETGRTIGLVEAMKSFNAIAYGGPGLPPRAAIVEIRAKDTSEVRQGATLLVVRPPR